MARWALALISAGIGTLLGGILGWGIGFVAYADDSSPAPSATEAAQDGAGGSDGWDGLDDEGSPYNPYPFDGVPFEGYDWSVVMNKAPRNATAEIMAAQAGHDAPADGMEFWIVPVTAQYIGGGVSDATAAQQIMVFFLDGEGRRYMDSCGQIPNDLAATGNPKNGMTVSGNLCVQVPKGADGVWGLFQEDGWLAYLSEDGTAGGTEA